MSKVLTAAQYEQKLAFEKWLSDNGLHVPNVTGWSAEYMIATDATDAIEYRHLSEGMSREPIRYRYQLSRVALAQFQGTAGASQLHSILSAKRVDTIKRYDAQQH